MWKLLLLQDSVQGLLRGPKGKYGSTVAPLRPIYSHLTVRCGSEPSTRIRLQWIVSVYMKYSNLLHQKGKKTNLFTTMMKIHIVCKLEESWFESSTTNYQLDETACLAHFLFSEMEVIE